MCKITLLLASYEQLVYLELVKSQKMADTAKARTEYCIILEKARNWKKSTMLQPSGKTCLEICSCSPICPCPQSRFRWRTRVKYYIYSQRTWILALPRNKYITFFWEYPSSWGPGIRITCSGCSFGQARTNSMFQQAFFCSEHDYVADMQFFNCVYSEEELQVPGLHVDFSKARHLFSLTDCSVGIGFMVYIKEELTSAFMWSSGLFLEMCSEWPHKSSSQRWQLLTRYSLMRLLICAVREVWVELKING